MREVHATLPTKVTLADSELAFDISVTLTKGEDSAYVRIAARHTNIVLIKKNGVTVYEGEVGGEEQKRTVSLSVAEIVEYADTVDIADIKPVLDRQINYNMAIAEEGLSGNWGANIGKVYLSSYAPDISIKAKAYAAAGSPNIIKGTFPAIKRVAETENCVVDCEASSAKKMF